MSILAENQNGWIISHVEYFERIEVSVTEIENLKSEMKIKLVKLNPDLFEISDPFVKISQEKIDGLILSAISADVKFLWESLAELGRTLNIFEIKSEEHQKVNVDVLLRPDKIVEPTTHSKTENSEGMIKFLGEISTINGEIKEDQHLAKYLSTKTNRKARQAASKFFEKVKDLKLTENNISGGNPEPYAITQKLLDHDFIFPKYTRFFCRNIEDLENQLNGQKFELIIMDPPWLNKYIRRRKRKQSEAGYHFLDNFLIQQLPIENICEKNALVVVWCTNSRNHRDQLIEKIFPKWGIIFITMWHWVKVTKSGVPICSFNEDNKKQPYESIIIGRWGNQTTQTLSDADLALRSQKVILSIPSSINSHKPPLIDVISKYFNLNLTHNSLNLPKCLELFARYLIPGFMSFGNEVMKLQHSSLYVDIDRDCN